MQTLNMQKDVSESYLSDSPSHFDTKSDDETEKNVELLASVATAFAKYDFPVPGGYRKSWFIDENKSL